jgi:hypothetical protein
MNIINHIIITTITLLHFPVISDVVDASTDKMTPGEMMKSSFMKTYKPINHEESVTFSLWEQKIKAKLDKKPTRKTSKK